MSELTYPEMVKILAENCIYVDRLAEMILKFMEDTRAWSEFAGNQVLTARAETLRATKKLRTGQRYTNKRITLQEENQKGLVTWLHEERQPTGKKLFKYK